MTSSPEPLFRLPPIVTVKVNCDIDGRAQGGTRNLAMVSSQCLCKNSRSSTGLGAGGSYTSLAGSQTNIDGWWQRHGTAQAATFDRILNRVKATHKPKISSRSEPSIPTGELSWHYVNPCVHMRTVIGFGIIWPY